MSSSPLRFVPAVARILLGLPLTVFGLNGFLNFIPPPEMTLPAGAVAFSAALLATGYMMPLIAITLLTVGVLLLLNRFVPLALVLFAPFLVNSLLFHAFLERSGLPMAGLFAAFALYLAWHHRAAYRALLTPRPALA